MRKKISFIICIAMIICMMPTSSAFAAKKIKAKSVSVAPKAVTIIQGGVVQLTATKNPVKSTDKLTWSSSNTKVATVSSKGLVSGKSAGTATITVKTTSKKKATCTVVVKKYLDENQLRQALKEELKKEFATKQDLETLISQDLYSKDEIDAKISAISTDTFATKQEVEALGQNFYTKEEINGMIDGNSGDWPDGTSIICLNEDVLPRTSTIKKEINGINYEIEIEVSSLTVKKYKVMDFVKDSGNGREVFVPYRYECTIKYKVSGFDDFHQAQIADETDDIIEAPYIEWLYSDDSFEYTWLDADAQELTLSRDSYEDRSTFYFRAVDLNEYL